MYNCIIKAISKRIIFATRRNIENFKSKKRDERIFRFDIIS